MESLPRWLEENNEGTCDANYRGTAYETVLSVKNMGKAVRFGSTNNFAQFFSSDNSEQADYVTGLIYFASIFFIFFLVWTVLIIVLKFMGPGNAGFLSGHHFVEPDPKIQRKPYRRPTIVRIIFMICSILVIAFAVLAVTEGYDNMQQVIVTWDDSSETLIGLAKEARDISDILLTVGKSSVAVRDELVGSIGDFCPDFDLEGETGIAFDSVATEAVSQLDELENFIDGDLTTLETNLDDGIETLEDAQVIVRDAELKDWYMMVYIIPLIVCTSLLMVATILAWMGSSFKWYQCVSSYAIFPFFFILVIFGWLLMTVIGVTAVVNSDLCSGGQDASTKSPEGTIIDILELRRADFDPEGYLYRGIVYYVQGCQKERNPFDIIHDYEDDIEEAMTRLSTLRDDMDEIGVERLGLLCGKDFGPIRTIISTMLTNLQTLNEAAFKTLDLLCCQRINQVYTDLFHNASCTYSVSGFTWFFSSLLVVSTCGMLMVMFRASWLDVEYAVDDELLEQPICTEENPMARYRNSSVMDEYDDGHMGYGGAGAAGAALGAAATYEDEDEDEDEIPYEPEERQEQYDDEYIHTKEEDAYRPGALEEDEKYQPDSAKSWEKYPTALSQDPPGDHDDNIGGNNDTYGEEDFEGFEITQSQAYDERDQQMYDDAENDSYNGTNRDMYDDEN